MTRAETVDEQYGDETRLARRRSVWRPGPGGRTPEDVAADAVRAAAPRRLLDIGCGTGAFASRLAGENPRAHVVATDRSKRLVQLVRRRGLTVHVADAGRIPFRDDSFDCVTAMWMLYHVPDLDEALGEVRRVLRPGGIFVAVTNGDEHLADLLRAAGGGPLLTQFSSENGAAALRRHFASVARTAVATSAVFPDTGGARAYLATFDATLAAGLPERPGPLTCAGSTAVFVAR